jgi:hypothetical protein
LLPPQAKAESKGNQAQAQISQGCQKGELKTKRSRMGTTTKTLLAKAKKSSSMFK